MRLALLLLAFSGADCGHEDDPAEELQDWADCCDGFDPQAVPRGRVRACLDALDERGCPAVAMCSP